MKNRFWHSRAIQTRYWRAGEIAESEKSKNANGARSEPIPPVGWDTALHHRTICQPQSSGSKFSRFEPVQYPLYPSVCAYWQAYVLPFYLENGLQAFWCVSNRVEELLKAGNTTFFCSIWFFPVVISTRKNRLHCGYYRILNQKRKANRFSLPTFEESFDELSGEVLSTAMDLFPATSKFC